VSERSKLLVGGGLAVLTLVLLALSWWTFESGKPGAPPFADARSDYGVDAGVRVYFPPGTGVKRVELQAFYRDDSGVTRQDLELRFVFGQPVRARIPIYVELREGARLIDDGSQRVQINGSPVDVQESRAGAQYVFFWLTSDGALAPAFQLSGELRIAALNTENSRSSFVSPKLGEICLYSLVDPGVDVEELTDRYVCEVGSDPMSRVEILVEGFLRTATRLDYVQPDPAEGEGTALRWVSDDADGGFRARASYVDIGQEADVQRYLFASGIVVGLAAAIAPAAVQLLAGGLTDMRRRRGREAAEDSAEADDPTVPEPDDPGGADDGPVPGSERASDATPM
jgi:hypothetical protein